jgi:protein-S-isoprenylcysteine O-methyltransferase Ste14
MAGNLPGHIPSEALKIVKLPALPRGASVAKPSGTPPKPPVFPSSVAGYCGGRAPYGLRRGRLSPFLPVLPHRASWRRRVKTNHGEHPWGDTGQLILFLLFVVLWAADSFFLEMSTFLSGYLPLYFRLLVMTLAMMIAAYLAKSGHVVASHEQRPTGVVATGAFRYVRHPLYLASLLFYFGFAVSTACLFFFGLLLVMFFFYDYIASYEENVLEGKYGEDYLLYKKKTGKWIPKLKSMSSNA